MMPENKPKKVSEELEFPETLYVRDVDDRVFQAIVLHCLGQITGIQVAGGSFLDSLLGRESKDRYKGIHIVQENSNKSLSVKVEVSIAYGVSIPEKSEEMQNKIVQAITHQTGLHVSCVHVVFRGVLPPGKNGSNGCCDRSCKSDNDCGCDGGVDRDCDPEKVNKKK